MLECDAACVARNGVDGYCHCSESKCRVQIVKKRIPRREETVPLPWPEQQLPIEMTAKSQPLHHVDAVVGRQLPRRHPNNGYLGCCARPTELVSLLNLLRDSRSDISDVLGTQSHETETPLRMGGASRVNGASVTVENSEGMTVPTSPMVPVTSPMPGSVNPMHDIDLSSPLNYGTPSSMGSIRTPRSGIRGTPIRQRPDIRQDRRIRQVNIGSDAVSSSPRYE